MNRKLRRILSKKLGEDFPLDKFFAIIGYYGKLDLEPTEAIIFFLKTYVPIAYDELDLEHIEEKNEDEFRQGVSNCGI